MDDYQFYLYFIIVQRSWATPQIYDKIEEYPVDQL